MNNFSPGVVRIYWGRRKHLFYESTGLMYRQTLGTLGVQIQTVFTLPCSLSMQGLLGLKNNVHALNKNTSLLSNADHH